MQSQTHIQHIDIYIFTYSRPPNHIFCEYTYICDVQTRTTLIFIISIGTDETATSIFSVR